MSQDLHPYILQKLDKLVDDVGAVRESQARMEVDVQHHIKRTDLLEEMVKLMRGRVDALWSPLDLIGRLLRWLKLIR